MYPLCVTYTNVRWHIVKPMCCIYTRTLSVLVLAFTTTRTGHLAPIQGASQQEQQDCQSVGSDTSLLSAAACNKVLIYGLAGPMQWRRWGTTWSDDIRIFILHSGYKTPNAPLHLIACMCCTISVKHWWVRKHLREKITQIFTLLSGVCFTSLARLVTKQSSNLYTSFQMPDLLAADLSSFWPTHAAPAPTGTHTA